MSSAELESIPPFSWTEPDRTFVANALSSEFPGLTDEAMARAIDVAAEHVSAAQGRVSLASATRQILRSL